MSKVEKTVNGIVKKLNEYNIPHEVSGDKFTFVIAPTATIQTENCTIDVYKDEIKVNEKLVNDLDEMIDIVIEVEG